MLNLNSIMIVWDFIKNCFLPVATFIFVVWELIRSSLWRNEDLKKQFTQEINNSAEKLEENLQQIKLIPIIVEELFLDKPNDFNLMHRLISIKASIEKLDDVLSKNCKIHSFKEYLFILGFFCTHLEDFESFCPENLYNELYKKLTGEKNKQYTKLISELHENIEKKLNIIEEYLSYKLYSNFLDFISEISKLQKVDIKNIKNNTLTFLKSYINNFLKLIRHYEEAYINENETEIDRIITETNESKSLYVLFVEFEAYRNNKSENEKNRILQTNQLNNLVSKGPFVPDHLAIFYSFIKQKMVALNKKNNLL